MTDPILGVKYRIQSVDSQLYLELLDTPFSQGQVDPQGTTWLDSVALRPVKETERQYWRFEQDPQLPDYTGSLFLQNVASTYHYLRVASAIKTRTGPPSSLSSELEVTQLGDGACGLSFLYNRNTYYDWYPDPDSTTKLLRIRERTPKTKLHKWRLVHIGNDYPVKTGVYRIRNLNGQSLMCGNDDNEISIESQLDQNDYYQRWNVTFVESEASDTLHTYVVQNVGSNLYLAPSESGDNLVGVETAFIWDLQMTEDFAISFCIPNKKLSIGLAEVDRKCDEPSLQLLPSDTTPNQMWYMENLKFTHNKFHPLPEGKYLLQSCHDQKIYMTGARSPYRITAGPATNSQFELKYINKESALFTLTYVTNSKVVPLVADGGEYVTLNGRGTQFLLVKQARGQCLICLPDSGDPGKVASARITTDLDDNPAFPIEDETGEVLQKWKFIPVK